MNIRPIDSSDFSAIDALVAAAFGREDEARLVRALRAEAPLLELGAEDGALIGHIQFSRIWIETGGARHPGAQLAPLAVTPGRQRAGVGGGLIHEGLARLKRAGETHVFVLGHADYYPRFGFSAQAAQAYQSPWPRPSFMFARLTPGGPERGALVVPEAFG
jgi:putative acetyltransferase